MIKLFSLSFLCLATFSCASPLIAEKNISTGADAGVKKVQPIVVIAHSEPAQKKDSSYAELIKAISEGQGEKIKSLSIDLLQSNKDDLAALNALAMYYYSQSQFEAAKLLLNKALLINPKSAVIYNNLALVELSQNKKQEALSLFQKAKEIDNNNYFAAANAAAIYTEEKDYQRVVFTFEKFINKEVHPDSFNNYAIALSAMGKDNEASEVFEKILKKYPDHKYAALNYAILMIEKQKRYKEGSDLLNKVKFAGLDNRSREVIKNLEIKAKTGLKQGGGD